MRVFDLPRLLLLVACLYAGLATGAQAADGLLPPAPELNYQGRLVENGLPVTGTRFFRFTILNATTQLFESPEHTVSVVDGLYAVRLTGFDASLLPQSGLLLRVRVGPTAGALVALAPDVALIPALQATTAFSVVPGAIGTPALATGAVEAAKIADGAVTAAKLAPGVGLPDQTGHAGKVLTTTGVAAAWATTPLMPWTTVSGTSQTLVGDHGYIANHAGLTTFTAPASPIAGQVNSLTGAGIGGWTLTLNAGQTLELGSPMASAVNIVWTPRESSRDWSSITSSSDGAKLAAGVYGGQIYTSSGSPVFRLTAGSERLAGEAFSLVDLLWLSPTRAVLRNVRGTVGLK